LDVLHLLRRDDLRVLHEVSVLPHELTRRLTVNNGNTPVEGTTLAISYNPDSTSGVLTSAYIANELNKISIALQDAVSRSADTPNTLTATLDVNSQQLINLVTPTTSGEPVTKGYGDSAYGNSGQSAADAAASAAAAAASEAAAAASEVQVDAVEGGLTGLIEEYTVTALNAADPIVFSLNEVQDKGYYLEITGAMASSSAVSFQINGITTSSYNTEVSRFSVGSSTHTAFTGATSWQGSHTGALFDDIYLQAHFDNKGLEGLFKSESFRKSATPVRFYAYGDGPVITLLSNLTIPGGLFSNGTVVRLFTKNTSFQPTAPIVPVEPYDVVVPVLGGPLGTTVPTPFFLMEVLRPFTLKTGLHRGHAVTGPTGSDATFTLKKNGSAEATLTFTTAGGDNQDATSTIGADVSFAAGDLLQVDLTTADSNDVMQDVTVCFIGEAD